MRLTDEDRKWLRAQYPLLQVKKNEAEEISIEGLLNFHAYYDLSKDVYIFNPTGKGLNKKYDVTDSYEILITSPSPGDILPIIAETKGRILSFAKAHKLMACDLHIDIHGICCLCPKLFDIIQYPKGISIRDFMYDLVIPFFYAQSFFETYRDWPAGAYSHGDLGILEYYAELVSDGYPVINFVGKFFDSLESKNQKLITDSAVISRQWQCICGKGAKFRHCHPKAMNGLRQLKSGYEQYKQRQ